MSPLRDVRSDLHLDSGELFALPVVPRDAAVPDVGVVVVGPVEQGEPAVVVPPPPQPLPRAVGVGPPVIVTVDGAEHHAVVAVERVLGAALEAAHLQPVLVALALHLERLVQAVHAVPVKVPQVDAQLVELLVGDEEDVVVSQPVFVGDLAEAALVLVPRSGEVHLPVLPPLEHEPATRGRVHVAPHRHGAGGEVGLDVVDVALSVALLVHLVAV